MTTQFKIGGIDASLWIGRIVRICVKRKSNKVVPCGGGGVRGTLLGIDAKGRCDVQPIKHKNSNPVIVDVKHIQPCWSMNPDLKEIADGA